MDENNFYLRIAKYAVPLVVAGAIALGGCSYESKQLPIDDGVKNTMIAADSIRTKHTLDSLAVEYKLAIIEAENAFNEKIKDKKLDIGEQRYILNKFEKAKKADSLATMVDANAKRQEAKYSDLKLPAAKQNLYDRLKENLYGIDYGTPELQYDLETQNLNVEVENIVSAGEGLLYVFEVLFGIGYVYYKLGL